jgi:outer membrane protein assembly factor BamB
VRAFDARDGRLIWSRDAAKTGTLPAVNSNSVVFAENIKFVGERRVIARVRSLDVTTGTERWSHRVRGPFWPHFETAADDVDVAVVDDRGQVTLLDAATGRVRWRRATKRMQLEVSPLLFGEVVAITAYGTGLAALARADGSSLANAQPGPVQYSVTIQASAAAGDRLYLLVQAHDGQAEVWALGPLVASG